MIKTIYFSDVNPISSQEISAIKKEISATIKKKDFILGNSVKKFEEEFSNLSKINYSVGCASGTDALTLALMSLNLQKDDEIIVPSMSYISTGLAVILNNNQLILSDIDTSTGLISIESVARKITKKTKAIIPVNLYGQKVDLKKLRKIIGNKIKIIEDSAQSHFAFSCYGCPKYLQNKCCKKRRNEQFADMSCYSFYPAKNIGAYGDGGLVATNHKKYYSKLLKIRNLGAVKKNMHTEIGINSRLDTIQAIVLRKKLKSILKLNDYRRKVAKYYDENLKMINKIKLTKTNPGSSRHLYIIRSSKRDKLLRFLLNKKILCQTHYSYSLNKLKPFRNKIKNKKSLKNSERWAKECLSLPIQPKQKKSQSLRVVKEIKRFFGN